MPTRMESPVAEPLLPSVAAGDRSAMEACLDRYEGLVWALARRFLGDSSEAEDAVQEVFIELWKHAGRFDPKLGTEVAFVGTLSRRRLLDARRRQSRRPDTTPMDEWTEAESQVDPKVGGDGMDDEGQRALAALRGLPAEQRRMMEWSLADGMSHGEIAARTRTPLGTVKTLIRRGLLRVREAIQMGEGTAR
jgi:RNA polymerase sigma-70 factor (ECF subfamily)